MFTVSVQLWQNVLCARWCCMIFCHSCVSTYSLFLKKIAVIFPRGTAFCYLPCFEVATFLTPDTFLNIWQPPRIPVVMVHRKCELPFSHECSDRVDQKHGTSVLIYSAPCRSGDICCSAKQSWCFTDRQPGEICK